MTRPRGPRARRSPQGLGAAAPVLALCWTAVFFDGFDVMVYGAVMPYMLDDAGFGLDPAAAGTIGSWTTFGMLLGALGAGNTMDWFGRRPMTVACVVVFSVGSGVCALATDPVSFGAGRLLAGLGLGGLLPTCLAVVAEFAPAGRVALATGVLMTAYHAGGMTATGIGMAVAPSHGWRWAFAAGVLPAVPAVLLLLLRMPESPAVLYSRGRADRAADTAGRYGLPLPGAADTPAGGVSGRLRAVADLVDAGRRRTTLLLWAASFCGLMLVYGVSTWLPQLMRSSGYGLGSSVSLLMVVNAGGIVGMLVAGKAAGRFGAAPVAGVWFALTAVSMLLLGTRPPLAVAYCVIALAGVWLFSAGTMVYAAAGRLYPPALRAPGIGWVTGVGRLGAVVSPWLGGVLVSQGREEWGFAVFALAGLVGAVTILLAAPRSRSGVSR
ncbi:MFS transporter [Streptomyces verrucosisporus]|uniref:MFS transporter n=1 Tax=Streptomyces verrucosisporus TaxID=1695161 RepID=UPI0027DA96B1|nr:MFS transporter [Streptomyces verrucosisporus]